jgi:hypothetical protein
LEIKMADLTKLDELDDRTILLILSYLTQDIRAQLPEADTQSTASLEDAEHLMAAMLVETGVSSETKAMKESLTDHEAAAIGRRLLTALAKDEELRPRIDELIDHPPQDEQMSVEAAIAGAVVLGMVVSWIQTKVKIHYSHKNGKAQFEFDLEKRPGSTSLLNIVVKSVGGLFSGLG